MKLHVFFHIEKAAGTSVLSALETIHGKAYVYQHQPRVQKFIASDKLITSRTNSFWDNIYKKLQRTSVIKPVYKIYDRALVYGLLSRGKWFDFDELPDDARAIHGHFSPSMITPIKRTIFKSTVIREPLLRMYSQYEHWKRIKGFAAWRHNIKYDPNITFEDYAFLPALKNFQSNALEYKDLSYFDLVGTTDHLDTFMSRIEQEFGTHQGNFEQKKLNTNTKKTSRSFEKGFEKKFKMHHKDDYDLYQKALKLTND